ncbi:LOW QUALITY PROTEIN: hypothetical protein BC938DRAFT_482812 [Jimgerdemannia flammicorona]|uniref:Uncharacterized protein n=1 Tax=Jimgerdemannia flammicorona TaxID=994334 RepID=A0A433QD99_9FUNG|nr:LOW QUALITY PROTEIN: hypothetical protein BC938DRAFT_482812 [Jimgerdemannia flammicorona]
MVCFINFISVVGSCVRCSKNISTITATCTKTTRSSPSTSLVFYRILSQRIHRLRKKVPYGARELRAQPQATGLLGETYFGRIVKRSLAERRTYGLGLVWKDENARPAQPSITLLEDYMPCVSLRW